jgi:23S rRNA (cytosine1962-C5)-methyltransferase
MSGPPLEALLSAALARRQPLLTAGTDAVRLVDGAGDGVPGVVLESFAGRWLASTAAAELPGDFAAWLRGQPVSCYWKRLDQRQKDSPAHISGPPATAPFLIHEHGLAFEISFQAGYSQGIFLDQRDNRAELRRCLRPGMSLLNTFAYTGGFSVAAAAAGAVTTTLDLSQPYLDWAKRNFTHNGLAHEQHHFCKGDTFRWLARFAKSGRVFDAIVLDPPTFSRDDSGKVFRVERDFGELVALALAVLAPGGTLLCCTNCRTLPAAAFLRQIHRATTGRLHTRTAPMPPDFTGEPYLKSVWVSR